MTCGLMGTAAGRIDKSGVRGAITKSNRERLLTAYELARVAQFVQLGCYLLAVVALNFNVPVLDSAACTTGFP